MKDSTTIMRTSRRIATTFLGLSPFVLLTACTPADPALSTDTDASSGSESTTLGTTTGEPATETSEDVPDDTTGEPDEPPPAECGAALHFASDKQPTRIVHVSPQGSDSPTCGASDLPCATLAAAALAVTPGTAVQVHGGTYTNPEAITGLAGTADAPVWITSAPDEPPPIFTAGMHFSGARYLVLRGLAFRDSTPLQIDDGGARDDPEAARFIALDRIVFLSGAGFYPPCVEFKGVNDFWIVDSQFTHCGGDNAAGVGVGLLGSRRGLVLHNIIDTGGDGFRVHAGSEDIEFRGNWVASQSYGAALGAVTGYPENEYRPPLLTDAVNVEATDLRAIANVFVGGIGPVDFGGCVDCLAANNTILRPAAFFGISQGSVPLDGYTYAKATGGRFVNNLVVFERAQIYYDVWLGQNWQYYTEPETFVAQSNLFYALDDLAGSTPALGDVQELDSLVAIDPRFVDLAAGDLHLAEGSPARASGMPLSELSGDLEGRCYGDTPNLGAFAWP